MKRTFLFHALILMFFLTAAFGTVTSLALSQGLDPTGGEDEVEDSGGELGSNGVILQNPIIADDLTELFEAIIDVVLVFAVPLIVFFIIYAGFKYVTARGNPSEIQKAHMALLFALIGGLLILGARVLIEVVGGTVDVFKE